MALAPHAQENLGSRSRQRPTAWATCAVAAALVVAGCGSDGEAKPTARRSSAPAQSSSPSPDPSAKATQTVLDVYRHYWDEQVKAYAKASPVGTDLEKYGYGKALSLTKGDLLRNDRQGIVFQGRPKNTPKVTALSLKGSPEKATITDCFDVGSWTAVYKKTGKSALTGKQVKRYIITSSARTVGSRWMISQISADRSRPC